MLVRVLALDLQSVTSCCLSGPFCVCHGDNGHLTFNTVCTLVRVVMSVCVRACMYVCVCVGV